MKKKKCKHSVIEHTEGIDFINELVAANLVTVEVTGEVVNGYKRIKVYPKTVSNMNHIVSFVTPSSADETLDMFQNHPMFNPNAQYIVCHNMAALCYEVWEINEGNPFWKLPIDTLYVRGTEPVFEQPETPHIGSSYPERWIYAFTEVNGNVYVVQIPTNI